MNPDPVQKLSSRPVHNDEVIALVDEVLAGGFDIRIRVTGNSMAPFLRGGEILTIRKVPCNTLCRGDLIFFTTIEGFLILHRIVEKQQGEDAAYFFRTKGDALSTMDELVREHDILGKVCKIERINPDFRGDEVNMELPVRKVMNFSLAIISAGKGKAASYPALAGLLRRIKEAFA